MDDLPLLGLVEVGEGGEEEQGTPWVAECDTGVGSFRTSGFNSGFLTSSLCAPGQMGWLS